MLPWHGDSEQDDNSNGTETPTQSQMEQSSSRVGLLRRWWESQLTIPTAGITAFRVAVGIGILITLVHLWNGAESFLFPERAHFHLRDHLSLFDLLPSVGWVKGMLLLGMLTAAALCVKDRPKWRAFFLVLLNLAIYAKVPGFLTGGDTLITILLVWFLFLPPPSKEGYRSIVCVGMKWQVVAVYLSSMLSKLKDSYWLMGDTVGLNLACFMWETRLGRWCGYHVPAGVHRLATHFTLLAEGSLLLAYFLPLGQPYVRRAGIVLLVLFHVGTGLTMQLGAFPVYMIGLLLMLLDGGAWAALAARVRLSAWRLPWNPGLYARRSADAPSSEKWFRFQQSRFLQSARALFLLFLFSAFAVELWNEVVGSRQSRLWVHTPWRRPMASWIGYNQNWSMFTLSDTQRSREDKKKRTLWTSVPVVLVRFADGTLWEPAANRPVRTEADWAQPFLTRQGRDSWLGKAVHVTGDTNFQVKLGDYYARLARSRQLPVVESLIYTYSVELHLPSQAGETYARLNPALTAWVERRAAIAFDPTGRCTGYKPGHGPAAPIPIPVP
jgi:hypothetical protein